MVQEPGGSHRVLQGEIFTRASQHDDQWLPGMAGLKVTRHCRTIHQRRGQHRLRACRRQQSAGAIGGGHEHVPAAGAGRVGFLRGIATIKSLRGMPAPLSDKEQIGLVMAALQGLTDPGTNFHTGGSGGQPGGNGAGGPQDIEYDRHPVRPKSVIRIFIGRRSSQDDGA